MKKEDRIYNVGDTVYFFATDTETVMEGEVTQVSSVTDTDGTTITDYTLDDGRCRIHIDNNNDNDCRTIMSSNKKEVYVEVMQLMHNQMLEALHFARQLGIKIQEWDKALSALYVNEDNANE